MCKNVASPNLQRIIVDVVTHIRIEIDKSTCLLIFSLNVDVRRKKSTRVCVYVCVRPMSNRLNLFVSQK